MNKHLSIAALVLAAGLAVSFSPGNGSAQVQGDSGITGGQTGPSSGTTSGDMSPGGQGELGTGLEERGMEEGGRLGTGSGDQTGQERFGLSPGFDEDAEQLDNRQQERSETGAGRVEQEELGVAPQTGEEEQGRLGTGSGDELPPEQFGVAPEARGGTTGRPGTNQQDRSGASPERAGQGQFGVAPRFESGEEQGWVGQDGERGGTGWRRKSTPGSGR